MRIEWFGQSAFQLQADDGTVVIDPFGDLSGARDSGVHFGYPPIVGLAADLLLITHEHRDHNGVEAVTGSPATIRSTAGVLSSPLGEVVAIASEHDRRAGTERGPNTIFVFTLGGLRVCHFGDFGQTTLRDEQAEAIGAIDLLFVPVGGGPTIDAAVALEVVGRLDPRWVVPMHYRTDLIDFLEPVDGFAAGFPGNHLHRIGEPSLELERLEPSDAGPVALVLAAPPP